MSKIKVIVNPNAGRGYGAQLSPRIAECLVERKVDFDLVHTRGPGHAIELAQQATEDGYDTIIAVGGDGTSHEVVNGLMAEANGAPVGTLGWVPAGSGNDFAAMNGTPTDLDAACDLVAQGSTRVVDVGHITIDGTIKRYFDNTVGIGFDGLVCMETYKHRNLRGMALYLPVVLKTIFLTLRPVRATITLDGRTLEPSNLMMVVVANGPREGGSFLVAPNALCNDGLFDVILVEQMSRLRMLSMVPRFMKGSHLSDRHISETRASHMIIRSEDPLYVHVDGEVFTDEAHEIELVTFPAALRVISPLGNGSC